MAYRNNLDVPLRRGQQEFLEAGNRYHIVCDSDTLEVRLRVYKGAGALSVARDELAKTSLALSDSKRDLDRGEDMLKTAKANLNHIEKEITRTKPKVPEAEATRLLEPYKTRVEDQVELIAGIQERLDKLAHEVLALEELSIDTGPELYIY